MIGISDGENGETPIFLRGRDADGTPQNIWGALVDTYANRSDGGLLSCAKFLYLTAGDGPDGLRRQYVTWEPDHRPAPHGPAPRHVIHARTDGTDLPRMHDARQRAGVSRLHLAGHGPKRRSMQAPAQDPIRRRALQTRRHLQTGRARRARIHPARPRNRRRLQPVQRELPQHGRQNGTRRHPAGHTSPLRRIRQTSQRTPRIHAHRPRPRARRDDARRMDMVAHGQRSTRRTAIGATQSQGIPGRHRPKSQQRIDELDTQIEAVKRTHERHRRRQPAATRQGLRTRTPGRRRGAQTTARHRRTVRTRRRQTPPPTSRHGTPNAPRSPCRSIRTTSVWKTRDPNTSGWWWNVTPGRANATC